MAESSRWTIEVTAEDIARAKKGDSYNCVVAQAVARTIKDATRIDVDTQTIRFTRESTRRRYIYLTPYSVQGYISAFDAEEPIRPFKFRLMNPHTVKKAAGSGTAATKAARMSRVATDHKTDDSGDSKDALALAELMAEFPELSKAPPKVFKSKKRYYGARVLRWNQIRAAETQEEP